MFIIVRSNAVACNQTINLFSVRASTGGLVVVTVTPPYDLIVVGSNPVKSNPTFSIRNIYVFYTSRNSNGEEKQRGFFNDLNIYLS